MLRLRNVSESTLRARAAWTTAMLILWMSVAPLAQTNTGDITGVVRDSSGGVLPGASVTATHRASGTVVERVTDTEGRVFLPALRVGEWDLTVALPGFGSQTHTGILLEIGRSLSLEFTMEVQGLAEQVVVRVATPLLQTATAEISDVIENREVVQLPLNGRNFLALALLSDAGGFEPVPRQRLRIPSQRGVRRGELFSSTGPAEPSAAAEPARRRPRRSARAEPDILLRQLRGTADAPIVSTR